MRCCCSSHTAGSPPGSVGCVLRFRNFWGSFRNAKPRFSRSFAIPASAVPAMSASALTGRSAAASSTTCTTRNASRRNVFPPARATCAALALSSLKWNPKNVCPGTFGSSRSHHALPIARTSGMLSLIKDHRSSASTRAILCLFKNRAVRNCAKTPFFATTLFLVAPEEPFPSIAAAFVSAMASCRAARFTASAKENASPPEFAMASFFNRFMLCKNHGSSSLRLSTPSSWSSDLLTRFKRTRAASTSLPCAGVSCFCRRARYQ